MADIPGVAVRWVRLSETRGLLREVVAVAGLLAVYAVAFALAAPFAGASAGLLSLVAVGMSGATMGTRAALIAGVAAFPITQALFAIEGFIPGEAILQVGGFGFGAVAVLLVGLALGRMHDLSTTARASDRSADRERKVGAHAVDALRGTEQRLDAVLRTLPVLLLAANLDGKIWLTEGRALRAFGLKAGAFDGWSIFDDFGVVDEKAIRRALEGVETTVPIKVASRVLTMRFVPLREADGEIVGMVGVSELSADE